MTKYLSFVAMCLLATACGSTADSGKQVAIPPVTMACTTSACQTNSTMYARMFITVYQCSESSLGFSVAASSSKNVSCSASGCTATFTQWVNSSGSTSTLPENTYYLCGVVAPAIFTGAWSGHVVAIGEISGQKISDTTTSLSLTDYANGYDYSTATF